MSKVWMSKAPDTCDTCGTNITTVFYDAKTKYGPWGCLCPSCFTLGPGIGKLGLGLGQEYTKKEVNGKVVWEKTGG